MGNASADQPAKSVSARLRKPLLAVSIIVLASIGAVVAIIRLGDHSTLERDELLPDLAGRAAGFNVVLVTLDTTRADRIGCYGYSSAETPNIDALAANGVLFEQAVTCATSTLPAHATILTGLTPHRHGAHENGRHRLATDHATLAERLQAAGYTTAAFVSSFVLDARYGLNQGFEVYDFKISFGLRGPAASLVHERRADDTTRAAVNWLRHRDASDQPAPFFLWVHYFDPHFAYISPLTDLPQFAGRPYDAEIAFMDLQLGRLLAAVDAHADRSRTLVVVASDHGEGLYEHGEAYHGIFLYESTLQAVLILSHPQLFDRPYRVADRLVGTVDITPTLIDLLGLPADESLDGVSLFGTTTPSDRTIYIETYLSRTVGCSELLGLRRLHDKFILAPKPEYYDLRRDPQEAHNRIDDNLPAAHVLRKRLASLLGAHVAAPTQMHALTAEERERLEGLGYLASVDSFDSTTRPDPKDRIELINETTNVALLISAGKLNQALPLARQLVAECGGYDLPIQQLVEVLEALGKTDEASQALETFVNRYPSIDMLIYATERYRKWGNERAFESALAAAELLDPKCGAVFKLRADAAFSAGRFNEAANLYRKALDLDPIRLAGVVRTQLHQAEALAAQREQP